MQALGSPFCSHTLSCGLFLFARTRKVRTHFSPMDRSMLVGLVDEKMVCSVLATTHLV